MFQVGFLDCPFWRRYTKGDGQKGFTLIELMITVALLAIMASVAAPAYQNFIESRRITTTTNLLLSSVNMARSEAIKRGDVVTLRAAGGGFKEGWCIYVGENGGACANEAPLRNFDGSDGLKINAGGDTQIEFSPKGSLNSPGQKVSLKVSSDDSSKISYLCIGVAGRASVNDSGC